MPRALEDIGQRAACALFFDPSLGNGPLGLGRDRGCTPAPVGGSGDRLCLAFGNIRPLPKAESAPIALADATEAKARRRLRRGLEVAWRRRSWIMWWSFDLGSSQPPARITPGEHNEDKAAPLRRQRRVFSIDVQGARIAGRCARMTDRKSSVTNRSGTKALTNRSNASSRAQHGADRRRQLPMRIKPSSAGAGVMPDDDLEPFKLRGPRATGDATLGRCARRRRGADRQANGTPPVVG